MEGYDLDKLRSEVREIRENTVNPRSRTTYLNSYSRFLAWAALNRQSYVSGWFIDTIGHVEDYTEQQLCAHVKQKLAQDRTTPPLDFDKLQAQDFVTWLVTLRWWTSELRSPQYLFYMLTLCDLKFAQF
ncbi:hypothetical protein L917_07084 [Phytophthora nicotianae]|uniref:Uncharacterized protein n=1 Tax=Phytophthora nicotianae TaxID=4792 RepID=W2LEC3_PHYNI|nr:hypothetical protein L917_07084 [Phytophthora nicotianae]